MGPVVPTRRNHRCQSAAVGIRRLCRAPVCRRREGRNEYAQEASGVSGWLGDRAANKLGRIAWAVLAKGRDFEMRRTDDVVQPA